MEKMIEIYIVCEPDDDTQFAYIDESVYYGLVSLLGCKSEQHITYDEESQTITVERTVFVDEVVKSPDEPIDLDVDNYVDIPGIGRVPQEVAPEGYVYIDGKLTKVEK